MAVILWVAIAAGAGIGLVAFVVGMGRREEAAVSGEPLPHTPLQRLARRSLWTGLLLAGVLVAWVGYFGADRTQADAGVRIAFELGLVGILAVFAVMTARIGAWLRRSDGTVDERDVRILGRAHGATSVAILFTVAVWQIALVERFHAAGAVPVSYVYLVFWSCVVVGLVAMPLGILIGYGRP